MTAKQELVDVLQVSAQVVELELALLDEWHNDPGTTADRRAEIRFTKRYIGEGFSSALRRTAHALNEAKALSESAVAHPPGAAHRGMVQATVDNLAARSEWPGPALSDPAFTNAMTAATSNADQAADNSEAVTLDCTQAGAPAPPTLVPAPTALRPALVSVARQRTRKAKRPSKPRKRPKRANE